MIQGNVSMKRERPAGVCTRCHTPVFGLENVRYRCGRVGNAGRCEGEREPRINLTDWTECPVCDASTEIAGCARCDGAGWIDVRDNPRLRAEIESERKAN